MAEYIEREAIGKAYMDLCLSKSRLAKSLKGAAFFQSDLLPEAEPTVKELFGLINAAPAADVVAVCRCRDCNALYREDERYAQHCCLTGTQVDDMDFCSYGERRGEDE